MFEDSLLESANRFRTRRGATTAFSVVLQSAVLGALVLLPLIYTEALPRIQMLGTLPAPPPRSAPPERRVAPPQSRTVVSELHDGRLVLPQDMPAHARILEDPAPPDTIGVGVPWGVPNSTGPADANSTLVSVLTAHTASPPPERDTERLSLSRGVTEGHLVRRVEP